MKLRSLTFYFMVHRERFPATGSPGIMLVWHPCYTHFVGWAEKTACGTWHDTAMSLPVSLAHHERCCSGPCVAVAALRDLSLFLPGLLE